MQRQHDAPAEQRPTLDDMNAVYDRYVKPLEAEHWGEFVAVSADGRTILGASANEVGWAARDAFGRGNYVFRVGPRAVGRI